MKQRKSQSGNTREQLTIPGMGLQSYSVDSADLRQAVGKNTHDPSWDLTKHDDCG